MRCPELGCTLLFLCLVATLAAETQQANRASPRKPNIVVILADDFGVGDIQAHYPNNRIPTPHLDRLVSTGD